MALKAGMPGLSAGNRLLTGGPGQAFVAKSVPFSSVGGKPLLRSTRATGCLFRYQLTANSELARTRGIRLFN